MELYRKRTASDPVFRISCAYRRDLATRFRNHLARKAASSLTLLGCSFKELKSHLEAKFLPGMTWKNWGRGRGHWHIDHIRPVSSFNLGDPAQAAACFHYSNLQPLWQEDNLRKHNKIGEGMCGV